MPIQCLTPKTQRVVDLLFKPEDRDGATRMLIYECGNNLPFLEKLEARDLERFRFAALKICNGDLAKLQEAVELAKTDWRDLLVAAQFAHDVKAHEKWLPCQKEN